jgi:hypothetical protein
VLACLGVAIERCCFSVHCQENENWVREMWIVVVSMRLHVDWCVGGDDVTQRSVVGDASVGDGNIVTHVSIVGDRDIVSVVGSSTSCECVICLPYQRARRSEKNYD